MRCARPACTPPTALEGEIPIATIDELLDTVDSKYTLVHLSARRAREINNYYHSLGEGLGQYVPPLVEQVDSNKPLSIAMEEIAAAKIVPAYPGDPRIEGMFADVDVDVDVEGDDEAPTLVAVEDDAADES